MFVMSDLLVISHSSLTTIHIPVSHSNTTMNFKKSTKHLWISSQVNYSYQQPRPIQRGGGSSGESSDANYRCKHHRCLSIEGASAAAEGNVMVGFSKYGTAAGAAYILQ
jgi:hypothetical protein